MYIVVTGAAGFVGSNIVKALNARGGYEVIAVDNLQSSDKFLNLTDCEIADYFDKQVFLDRLHEGLFDGAIAAVLHQGACSDTTERDGRYMMQNNYEYSKRLLEFCAEDEVPLVYASSAAVYGASSEFREERNCEGPLNVYGYSKFLFDHYVRSHADGGSPVVGLRYFNVYGDRERHKGRMASVAMHFFDQYSHGGRIRLFEGSGGYADGEQQRDFVSVEDVVKVNLYFLDNPDRSGIFNVGTGRAQSFNAVAVATVNACRAHKGQPALTLEQMKEQHLVEYIDFPADLMGKYQNFTQADISRLRGAGYGADFLTVEQGVTRYVERLLAGR